MREGVKQTAKEEGNREALSYHLYNSVSMFEIVVGFFYVFTSVFPLTTTPRVLPGHSKGCS